MRAASIAVLPPPMTKTSLPRVSGSGVSYLSSIARIRLTRVRNSFADITPSRCSPGTFMKVGRPAPVPTKIFQKPAALRSSSVAVLPTTKLRTKRPPSSVILLDHVVDQLVRQAELRDAVAQHAAELVEGLEHRDRESLDREQVGVDQARRARADHRDRRLVRLGPRADAAGEAPRDVGVHQLVALRQEPLELADLDRPLACACTRPGTAVPAGTRGR